MTARFFFSFMETPPGIHIVMRSSKILSRIVLCSAAIAAEQTSAGCPAAHFVLPQSFQRIIGFDAEEIWKTAHKFRT